MKPLYLFITIFISSHPAFSQYQFPNNAIDKLKNKTENYAQLIRDSKYLNINMEIYNRYDGGETDVRTTGFYKIDNLVVISGDGFEYYIDDSLMFFSDYGNKKIFITKVDQINDTEGAGSAYANALVLSFDSILNYCSSVVYTEKTQDVFQVTIDRENLYVFDNLENQTVYYSPKEILPDSIVKTFYADVPYTEVTTFTSYNTKKNAKYSYKNAWAYFYDENNKPLTKFKDFSYSIL